MTSRIPSFLKFPVWALLSLIGLTWVGCGGESAEPGEQASPAPIQTKTAQIETVAVPDVAWVTGSVTAVRRAEAGTKILGRVERVAAEEGQSVRKGQLLVKLEDGDLRAGVAQAEAAVAMAEAQLDNARAQQARMQELHGRGSVTDKNLEDAVAGLRVAEAQVQQAKANVQAARAMLDYATVSSPFDGVVVGKFVEEGDMARPGAPLMSVEDVSDVDIVTAVPEALIAGRSEDEAVRVEAGGTSYDATIHRIVPAGDATSRTFQVEIRLANGDGALKSGMFARVGFAGGTKQTLLLPASAVVERGQLRGAWIVAEDGTASIRWLRLGAEQPDGRIEILSGLEGGERVVLDPPAGLTDGTPIHEEG